MLCNAVVFLLMLELQVHRSGGWEGKMDGYKVGKRKNELESTSTSWNPRGQTGTHVSSHCVQTWWCGCHAGETGAPSYLVQESEKLKEGPGQGGAVAGLWAPPCQWGEPADQQQSTWITKLLPRPCECKNHYSHCFSSNLHILCNNVCVAHPNWKHTWKRTLGNVVHPKLAHYKATTAMRQQSHSSIHTQEKCVHMFTKTCSRIYNTVYGSHPFSAGVTF